MDQKQEHDIDVSLQSSEVPKVVSPANGETNRRPQGRPAGSRNKSKPPIIVMRDSADALKAHTMEVSSGCDVNESLLNFARRKQCGICMFSGTGCVTNVTLRQPASSGGIVTLYGRFEILSLLGSILPPPAPPGITGLTIYLAGAQGQVVGGGMVGALIASGPIVIMAATFMNAALDQLPLDDNDEAAAAMVEPIIIILVSQIPMECPRTCSQMVQSLLRYTLGFHQRQTFQKPETLGFLYFSSPQKLIIEGLLYPYVLIVFALLNVATLKFN